MPPDHLICPLRRLESNGRRGGDGRQTPRPLPVGSRYAIVRELGGGDAPYRAARHSRRRFQVDHWARACATTPTRGYNGYTIQAGRVRVLLGDNPAMTTASAGLRRRARFDLGIMPVELTTLDPRPHCNAGTFGRWPMDAGWSVLPVHSPNLRAQPGTVVWSPSNASRPRRASNPDRVAVRRIAGPGIPTICDRIVGQGVGVELDVLFIGR